jgi:hypothetical protein
MGSRTQEQSRNRHSYAFPSIFTLISVMILVGNQVDKPGRKIENSEANHYAESIGALCFDTSAKQNNGNALDLIVTKLSRN